MTKADLVEHVATAMQLPKHQTDTVITQFLQAIMAALQAGVVYLQPAGNSISSKNHVKCPHTMMK